MASTTLIHIIVLLIISSICTGTDEKQLNSIVKCQFGKSPRKQIEVMPLNGVCLRDMVVHLSNSLINLSKEELGVLKFQKMLDQLEFVDSITMLNNRLNDLAKNLNDKLKKYTALLRDSNSVLQPVLLKQGQDIYSNVKSDSNKPDICSKIIDALAMNLQNQDWKNLHILPVRFL